MTIVQLRYFLTICDCRSVTHAASVLFLSQQALSKSIHLLEEELGTALFLRTPNGVVLTNAGRYLRDECRPIVERFDRFSSSVQHTIGKFNHTLRLCIFEDCFSFIPIEIFQQFQLRFPQYSLEIQEHQFQICNQRLLEGSADVILTIEPISNHRITNIPLQSRRLVMVLRKENVLASQPVVTFNDLRDQKIVMSIDSRGYQFVCQLFRRYALPLGGIQRVSQLSNMFSICNGNGYLGLTADYSAEKMLPLYPEIITRPLEGQPAPYLVTLAYHTSNHNSDALNDFIRWIQAAVPQENSFAEQP